MKFPLVTTVRLLGRWEISRKAKFCNVLPASVSTLFNSPKGSFQEQIVYCFCCRHYRTCSTLKKQSPYFSEQLLNCSQDANQRTFYAGIGTTSKLLKKDTEQTTDAKTHDTTSTHSADPELKALLKEIASDFEKSLENQKSQDESESSSSDSESSESESDLEKDSSEGHKPTSNHNAIDIDKELLRYNYEEYEDTNIEEVVEEKAPEETPIIPLKRGSTGVYDIEELVQLLNEENAQDLCVISVPEELKYVDYMVIVTGRSTRHLRAMAEYTKKVYKRKRVKADPPTCMIEGQHSSEWLAVDLGNIALHLFTESVRERYDLETLWTVGPEFDNKMLEDEEDVVPFFWEQSTTEYDFENSEKSSETSDHQLTLDSMKQWHQKPS